MQGDAEAGAIGLVQRQEARPGRRVQRVQPGRALLLRAVRGDRALLQQPGVPQYVDAVGVHPYSPDIRGVRYQLKIMRAQLRA